MTIDTSEILGDLPAEMPWPTPTADEAVFWNHCNNRRLAFQACADCGRLRHPPSPICPACRSFAVAWRDAPDIAEVFTYTIVHRASHASVEGHLPYALAVVAFPELGDIRLVTNIVGSAADGVHIGMKVARGWRRLSAGQWLPVFHPLRKSEVPHA